MLRNFIAAFEKTLLLSTRAHHISKPKWRTDVLKLYKHRHNCSSSLLRNVKNVETVADDQCVVPYQTGYDTSPPAIKLVETLRSRFRLSASEVQNVMSDEVASKKHYKKSLLLSMDLLIAEGILRKNFVEYPWIITFDKGNLEQKIDAIKSLRGFRDINDFVPFLRINLSRLRRLIATLNREADSVMYGNRVNYIAHKLQVPVSMVTKYLSQRLFILEMPFNMFERNLEIMLKYNVESTNILKDLWAFRYAPRSVEMRLNRATSAKKDKIMPWMVRCPESILQKSLQITMDDLEVLGNRTTAEYIAERLGFNVEEAQAIMNRHPQVNTVRVKKIKEVLDFLLDDAKFSRHEVAQVPRILCHGLNTTKKRLDELAQYGCRPSSLVILCKSKREYEKFLNSWIQKHNKTRNIVQSNEEINGEDQQS